ncbi:MAG: sulfatase-like hydrolase/transferase, partial [Bacilli bacterium]
DKYYKLMKKAYYAQITHIDYQIGRLVRFLQKNSLYDETLIIFTSDHGEMLGDHHMLKKSVPFNAAIKIPLIIKGSSIKPKVENKLITHIDIMPTILEFLDQKKAHLDGVSILSDEKRDVLVGEHPSDKGWNYIIDGNYKYIWDSIKGQEWIFDFKHDQLEIQNLIGVIDNETLEIMRDKLVNSFKERNLTQFLDGNKLKTGSVLPACDENITNINL